MDDVVSYGLNVDVRFFFSLFVSELVMDATVAVLNTHSTVVACYEGSFVRPEVYSSGEDYWTIEGIVYLLPVKKL